MSRLTWSRHADKHSPGRPRNKRFSQWVRSGCRGNTDVWPALFPVWVCACVDVCVLASEWRCVWQLPQVSDRSIDTSLLVSDIKSLKCGGLDTAKLRRLSSSHTLSSRHTKTFADNCEYSGHFWEQTMPLVHTSRTDRCRLPTPFPLRWVFQAASRRREITAPASLPVYRMARCRMLVLRCVCVGGGTHPAALCSRAAPYLLLLLANSDSNSPINRWLSA